MAFSDLFLALTVLFVAISLFTVVMKEPAASVAGQHRQITSNKRV